MYVKLQPGEPFESLFPSALNQAVGVVVREQPFRLKYTLVGLRCTEMS